MTKEAFRRLLVKALHEYAMYNEETNQWFKVSITCIKSGLHKTYEVTPVAVLTEQEVMEEQLRISLSFKQQIELGYAHLSWHYAPALSNYYKHKR